MSINRVKLWGMHMLVFTGCNRVARLADKALISLH